MKKLISILLTIAMMTALAACGNKTNTNTEENPDNVVVDVEKNEKDDIDATEADIKDNAEADNNKPATKPTEKPAENQTHYPNQPVENKPAENKPTENKPAENPTEKPVESKPAEEPAEKPAENKPAAPATLGNKLLAEFKAKASGMDTEALANALVSSSFIEFSGMAMAVEEGLLTGFGNTEIKGFKSGAVFAPMIGSIPFVGYVFELENASDVSSFIANLKSTANLRWNVCTEAEEMVTGSVGNKVFFVMCPTDFED